MNAIDPLWENRVRIKDNQKALLYNVTRKNMNQYMPKPYNRKRGQEGTLYGRTKQGQYVVNLGQNQGAKVDPENIEFLHRISPRKSEQPPCNHCDRKTYDLTTEEVLSRITPEEISNQKKMKYVNQNSFNLYSKKRSRKKRYTSGLASCVAIQFTMGDAEFLAHISAMTDMGSIVLSVIKHNPEKSPITDIKIWKGIGGDKSNDMELFHPTLKALENVYLLLSVLSSEEVGMQVVGPIQESNVCFAEIVPPLKNLKKSNKKKTGAK